MQTMIWLDVACVAFTLQAYSIWCLIRATPTPPATYAALHAVRELMAYAKDGK